MVEAVLSEACEESTAAAVLPEVLAGVADVGATSAAVEPPSTVNPGLVGLTASESLSLVIELFTRAAQFVGAFRGAGEGRAQATSSSSPLVRAVTAETAASASEMAAMTLVAAAEVGNAAGACTAAAARAAGELSSTSAAVGRLRLALVAFPRLQLSFLSPPSRAGQAAAPASTGRSAASPPADWLEPKPGLLSVEGGGVVVAAAPCAGVSPLPNVPAAALPLAGSDVCSEDEPCLPTACCCDTSPAAVGALRVPSRAESASLVLPDCGAAAALEAATAATPLSVPPEPQAPRGRTESPCTGARPAGCHALEELAQLPNTWLARACAAACSGADAR